MYTAFWHLKEKPFENTPDPRFLYISSQHKEALGRSLYVVKERKGGVLLTGEYGSGKTLLTRVIWHELQKEHVYQAVFILNPRLSGLQFIKEITYQLACAEPPSAKIDLFHVLNKALYLNHSKGKHSVIVIDEAQAIKDRDIFEELRLLLNFQMDNAFLLTIILLGQPELRDIVAKLPQLSQRMSVRYHLKELTEAETKDYIRHRLIVAGEEKPIFTEKAYQEVYRYSGGIPRRINNICDMALLVGYGDGREMVDEGIISKVSEDCQEEHTPGLHIGISSFEGVAPEQPV